jgi:hypothetical protein
MEHHCSRVEAFLAYLEVREEGRSQKLHYDGWRGGNTSEGKKFLGNQDLAP